MIYRGNTFGLMTWGYNASVDECELGITVGFGGLHQRPQGEWGPPYRLGFSIIWRKMANCVNWWTDYLGVERGRVMVQYRVHSFQQSPISIRFYKATA